MKWFLMIALAACTVAGMADEKKCASTKVVAQVEKSCDNCAKGAKSDDAFLAEAARMAAEAEGKEACCKSTVEKPMAKGDPGCCNAKGAPAKFKVFVAGVGYKYFGCEDSAGKGRSQLLAKGAKVGPVQKVAGKVAI
ncbi:MAG: hypothetical protein KIS66_16990 [Fimbriimonadaceae bacterium]|nr:hypothetical protein [Fimbriimonadaceae bacterium]